MAFLELGRGVGVDACGVLPWIIKACERLGVSDNRPLSEVIA